jgi:hypothetical protein
MATPDFSVGGTGGGKPFSLANSSYGKPMTSSGNTGLTMPGGGLDTSAVTSFAQNNPIGDISQGLGAAAGVTSLIPGGQLLGAGMGLVAGVLNFIGQQQTQAANKASYDKEYAYKVSQDKITNAYNKRGQDFNISQGLLGNKSEAFKMGQQLFAQQRQSDANAQGAFAGRPKYNQY